MKIFSITKLLSAIACLSSAAVVFGQGIPSEQWTASERQFVEGARGLYQQQGLNYSSDQASQAVYQMRQQKAPVQRGVPKSEWTQQEQKFVDATKQARGSDISEEQERLIVQSMREQIARLTGVAGAFQMFAENGVPQKKTNAELGANQSPNNSGNAMSEEQLGQAIAAWRVKPGDLSIRGRRDGFDVNGQPFLDSEGRMFSYAFDITTGAITFAVQNSRGLTIKALNASDISKSVVIATGTLQASGWEIRTVTGKQLSGDTLSILSNGFLVGRTASAFRYQPGSGVRSISIPSGYVLAPLQRGNVGATGFLLLEKEQATGGNNPLGQIFSSMESIGSVIGLNKKSDYALINIQSGNAYPLNIPANGKQRTLMSQCRQRNWLISECQRSQTVESVYGEDGYKNNSHYYWLVNWMQTPSGPISMSLEDGLANIYITDLTTGKKVVALNRTLGIADWETNQRSDGNVSIKAKLAFEWKEVPDAVEFLRTSN